MTNQINKETKKRLLRQVIWDYNIPGEDIEAVLNGKKKRAGHYSREMLFKKIIETYPWFTVIQLFTPKEIETLLTNEMIKKLRTPSLKNKYEFIRKRLQEIIPSTG